MLLSCILYGARENLNAWGEWRNWHTRTTQNRVPKGMWVRLPPRPQNLPLNVLTLGGVAIH